MTNQATEPHIERIFVDICLGKVRSSLDNDKLLDALGYLGVVLNCYPSNGQLKKEGSEILLEVLYTLKFSEQISDKILTRIDELVNYFIREFIECYEFNDASENLKLNAQRIWGINVIGNLIAREKATTSKNENIINISQFSDVQEIDQAVSIFTYDLETNVAYDLYSSGSSLEEDESLNAVYLKSLRMIERLHRLLLDVIKNEFERIGQSDVNSVQALLLYNIGEAELTAGELRSRSYYLGSNVSYNLKKLVDNGFISHNRSETDRRSVRVRLTEKGKNICKSVDALFERQLQSLEKVGGLSQDDLKTLNSALSRVERFWSDQIRFRL